MELPDDEIRRLVWSSEAFCAYAWPSAAELRPATADSLWRHLALRLLDDELLLRQQQQQQQPTRRSAELAPLARFWIAATALADAALADRQRSESPLLLALVQRMHDSILPGWTTGPESGGGGDGDGTMSAARRREWQSLCSAVSGMCEKQWRASITPRESLLPNALRYLLAASAAEDAKQATVRRLHAARSALDALGPSFSRDASVRAL